MEILSLSIITPLLSVPTLEGSGLKDPILESFWLRRIVKFSYSSVNLTLHKSLYNGAGFGDTLGI